MANINTEKNPVEILTELRTDKTKVEYIVINGVKYGIMGSVNEADRAAAINALNKAYVASGGDIYKMMANLSAVATFEENGVDPDEVVKVNGVDIILSYDKATAYDMSGNKIANCTDLPAMPKEAIKAVLMARVEAALK